VKDLLVLGHLLISASPTDLLWEARPGRDNDKQPREQRKILLCTSNMYVAAQDFGTK